MSRLAGRIAMISGAARGMGAATARAFVTEGAKVLIGDVLACDAKALADELGEAAMFCPLDVSSEDDWRAALVAAEERFGAVDVLVNNAGIQCFKSLLQTDKKSFKQVLDVNLVGTFLGLRHVGEAMVRRGRGSIVNICSVDALRGANGYSAYIASKWGVRGLTRNAALEFGPRGVRVNSVYPGGVLTAMGNPQGAAIEVINQGYRLVPMQRVGMPEEVAQATVFLASDQASYVCGAELVVDGGWSAGVYHATLAGAPGVPDSGSN